MSVRNAAAGSLAALTVVAALACAPVGAADRIGTTSTVRNTVTGTVAGRLRPGTGIYQREVIRSETGAEAQLIFRDETVFNVGSGAEVTLDEFVYDPNRKTGNIVLNVTKGAFRFISGSAKSDSYTIKTPVATIGVRGTVFAVDQLTDLYMSLRLLQGQLFICLVPGADIEGSGIDRQGPTRQNGRDCYLVSPGLFNVGFGPLEDFQSPPNDTTEPNDALEEIQVEEPDDFIPEELPCEECIKER